MADDEFCEYVCGPCSRGTRSNKSCVFFAYCSLGGRTKEANNYCRDCPDYLCDNCKDYHGKQAGTTNHDIVSISRNTADSATGIDASGSQSSQHSQRQALKQTEAQCSTDSTKLLKDRKIKSRSEVNIRTDCDTSPYCWISGCTVMANGHVVICDKFNNKVKLFDNSWTITGRLKLTDVWDVSAIDASNVIVSSPNAQQLQKVQVFPQMEIIMTIMIGRDCWGVAVSVLDQEIYTTCFDEQDKAEVRILDLQGNLKRRIAPYEDSSSSAGLFSHLYNITISPSGERLFVSDEVRNTITCMINDLLIVYEHIDYDIIMPRDLICDSQDNVLVCDFATHTVREISSDGQDNHILLTSNDGLRFPCAIAYKQSDDTLIVGCNCSDNLLLFKLA